MGLIALAAPSLLLSSFIEWVVDRVQAPDEYRTNDATNSLSADIHGTPLGYSTRHRDTGYGRDTVRLPLSKVLPHQYEVSILQATHAVHHQGGCVCCRPLPSA